MQKLAGFPYVVRPFTRSRRSLRYPATSFPRILCCQPLSQRAIVCCCQKRCEVVVARATYFISLKDVSFAPKNQRSKHCGHSRDRTCDPFLRMEMLYPLSYVSVWGLAMQLTSPVSAAADNKRF